MPVWWDEEGPDSCFIIFVKRRTWQGEERGGGYKSRARVFTREQFRFFAPSSTLLSSHLPYLIPSFFSRSCNASIRESVKISSHLFPSHYARYRWTIRLLAYIYINRYFLVTIAIRNVGQKRSYISFFFLLSLVSNRNVKLELFVG